MSKQVENDVVLFPFQRLLKKLQHSVYEEIFAVLRGPEFAKLISNISEKRNKLKVEHITLVYSKGS